MELSAELCIGFDIVRGKLRVITGSARCEAADSVCEPWTEIKRVVARVTYPRCTSVASALRLHSVQRLVVSSLAFFSTRVREAIADATNGFDTIREFAEFAAKSSDVHVDCA